MINQKLKVLTTEQAATRGVIVPENKGPVYEGIGDVNYECGGCGKVLLRSVGKHDPMLNAINVAWKCQKCGAVNAYS